jgi:hypothetical protein
MVEKDEIGVRDLLAAVEKHLSDLRAADLAAAAKAHDDVSRDVERLDRELTNRILELERENEAAHNELQKSTGRQLTVDAYDLQHQAVITRLAAVERWQYKLIGGLVFATFVAPMLTGLIVYLVTKELL